MSHDHRDTSFSNKRHLYCGQKQVFIYRKLASSQSQNDGSELQIRKENIKVFDYNHYNYCNSYNIKRNNGRIIKRHISQLKGIRIYELHPRLRGMLKYINKQ